MGTKPGGRRPKPGSARASIVREDRGMLSVTATEAKNRFGPVLEQALQGHPVVITRHRAPKAVLLSMTEYDTLARARSSSLHVLTGEFDALLDGMQGPPSRAAMKAAFGASPRALGAAAVAAARRRRG